MRKLTVQELALIVDNYLADNYDFRNNCISGKSEVRRKVNLESPVGEWQVVTTKVLNTIVRKAEMDGVGDTTSPQKFILQYINSDAIPAYDPVNEYLDSLPEWDGKDRVAEFFGRIPGISVEQRGWCATWLRSAVAHWMNLDMLHGNECAPILIGDQGCGKSTFANRLLPAHLRTYFLDHINFGNKFDCDMALTHNLMVNIDEFANMGPSQQGKLKQTLSRVKVNGRPIFGKSQEDRRRYASFIATTNDLHPLCDPTGSRRFPCIRIPRGMFIDNATPIDYDQLYAQVVDELKKGMPYWFNNDEVARIQKANTQFMRTNNMETAIAQCYRVPEENETGEWISSDTILERVQSLYPSLKVTKIKVGLTLRTLGCQSKHTRNGAEYQLIPCAA